MEEKMNKYDLTEGSIPKKLLLFFLPIAAGTLFQQFYNTVDAIVVSKWVGTQALAAVGGSASQILNILIGFFVALTAGAGTVIAQLYGAKREEMISKAVSSSLSFCFWVGLVITGVGILIAPVALGWMNTPADTIEDASLYLKIYFSGTVFVLLFNMGSSILRAAGDSRRPLIYLVVSCAGNIVLDILFVVGFHMGVVGVGLATVISQVLSTALIFIHLLRTKNSYRLDIHALKIHGPTLGRMLKIGIPAGIQATVYNFSNLIIQVGINSLGTAVVAGWSMSGKIDGIYWAISGALGTAIMSFVGQNYGAKKVERIHRCYRLSLVMFLGLTLVLEVVLLLIGKYAMPLFVEDPDVQLATWKILTYMVPYYLIWTFIEIISGLLRGVGDAVIPVTITAVGICGTRLLWVGLVFSRFPSLRTITFCYPVSWLLTGIALTIYYYKFHRKKMAREGNL